MANVTVVFVKNAMGPTFGPYEIGDEVVLADTTVAKLTDATSGVATKTHPDPTHANIKKRGDAY
jgi:hypothetical protein